MFKHTTTLIAIVLLAAGTAQTASASSPVMLGNSASGNVLSTVAAVPGDDWFFSFGNDYHSNRVGFGFGLGWNSGYHTRTIVKRPRIHRRVVVRGHRPARLHRSIRRHRRHH